MNFCGIVAEFNPFHNGHEYLIRQAKKITGLPVCVIMSGNFVQRGEPAIIDKYIRATNAINSGADMVVELPCLYAISSAQNFAYGAIKCLKEMGCTKLVVGAKYTNFEDYNKLASIKSQNIKQAISKELEKGLTYSQSLTNVLKTKYDGNPEIFGDASNILALEYIEQIINQKANIEVILLERTDDGYNGTKICKNYASASQIREFFRQNDTSSASKFVPSYANNFADNIINTNCLKDIVLFQIRKFEAKDLEKIYDYSEGLPYLICNNSKLAITYDELIDLCKSKRYKSSRIKKLLLYPVLEITKTKAKKIMSSIPAIKVLAIKKQSKALIRQINKQKTILIVSKNDYQNLNANQKISAKIDIDATNLFSIASQKKYNSDITTGTIFIE